MQAHLDAHDRGSFYLVYNAMTDSEEASLQARVATFSGPIGGAAFSANRLGQEAIGPGTADGRYPGIYLLSQEIAQSALTGIKAANPDTAGFLDDLDFFDSARQAWINRNVVDYFPGNLLDGTQNVLSEVGSAFMAAFWAQWGEPDEEQANLERVVDAVDGILERLPSIVAPGAWLSILATLVHDRFSKQPSDLSGGEFVQGPNGFLIHVEANGHVDGTFVADSNSALAEATGIALAAILNTGTILPLVLEGRLLA